MQILQRRRGRAVVVAFALLVGSWVVWQRDASGQGCGNSPTNASCTRVLFIGDSFTSVNDLPSVFASLASAGGHRVTTGMLAPGGSTLADAVASPTTERTIAAERWTFVVLQEQSQIPSLSSDRQAEMDPAARTLVGWIRANASVPMFFLTWAHQAGWPEVGLDNYAAMQAAVDTGYLGISEELGAPVAPVGAAWQSLLAEQPSAQLWQSDGVHPTSEGTYLAACVFYSVIFHQSPVGLGYHDGLSPGQAATAQQVAESVVTTDPSRWGLL